MSIMSAQWQLFASDDNKCSPGIIRHAEVIDIYIYIIYIYIYYIYILYIYNIYIYMYIIAYFPIFEPLTKNIELLFPANVFNKIHYFVKWEICE